MPSASATCAIADQQVAADGDHRYQTPGLKRYSVPPGSLGVSLGGRVNSYHPTGRNEKIDCIELILEKSCKSCRIDHTAFVCGWQLQRLPCPGVFSGQFTR